MAEFVTVMKEAKRMCKFYHKECSKCRMKHIGNKNFMCFRNIWEYPEEAELVIMKWSAEHPVETLKDHFFKLFPNAPKAISGEPKFCIKALGVTDEIINCNVTRCRECWNRPWEGVADGN